MSEKLQKLVADMNAADVVSYAKDGRVVNIARDGEKSYFLSRVAVANADGTMQMKADGTQKFVWSLGRELTPRDPAAKATA